MGGEELSRPSEPYAVSASIFPQFPSRFRLPATNVRHRSTSRHPMKKLVLVVAAASAVAAAHPTPNRDLARWRQEAQNVTIIRDDWGIPHIYGKTDADAVFGLLYAQAEDDFNRVETNYINAMGRLAEVKGESELYNDLLIRLVIDSADAI